MNLILPSMGEQVLIKGQCSLNQCSFASDVTFKLKRRRHNLCRDDAHFTVRTKSGQCVWRVIWPRSSHIDDDESSSSLSLQAKFLNNPWSVKIIATSLGNFSNLIYPHGVIRVIKRLFITLESWTRPQLNFFFHKTIDEQRALAKQHTGWLRQVVHLCLYLFFSFWAQQRTICSPLLLKVFKLRNAVRCHEWLSNFQCIDYRLF